MSDDRPETGVFCPGCGRQYAADRFASGRTIHCACGRRVGAARVPEPDLREGRPRFFADAMLGRLARWLRALGFDTAYREHIEDADLVQAAMAEGRIVLTRDRRMPEEWRYAGIHLVRSESPREQLAEIAADFDLAARARPFARCIRCNEPLEVAHRDSVHGAVPERIHRHKRRFRRCPACDRVYWSGSHTHRMRRTFESILGTGGPSPDDDGDPTDDGVGRSQPDEGPPEAKKTRSVMSSSISKNECFSVAPTKSSEPAETATSPPPMRRRARPSRT